VVGVAVTVLALFVAGDLQARSGDDPAVALRVALPVAELLRNLAVAAVLGLLIVAVWVLGPADRVWARLLDAAAAAASAWATAAAVTGVLIFVSASGLTPEDPGFSGELIGYLTGIELGRAWASEAVAAAVLAALCLAVRSHTGALVLLLLSAGILLPVLVSHAAGGRDELVEVPALVIHVIGAGMWTGGLAVVALLVARRPAQLHTVLARYGEIALLCLIAVTVSGTVSALLHLGPGVPLGSSYALLVVVKVGLLIGAGVFGGSVRVRLLRRFTAAKVRRGLAAVLGVELLVLAAAFGVAAALVRTPSPESTVASPPIATPAEALTGRPLPAPFVPLQLVASWRPDLVWIGVGAILAVGYGVGIAHIWRSGGRWPVGRMLAWYGGVAALVLLTSGGANVYGQVLLSVHVVSKLVLLVPIPALLIAGAPGRLIESAASPRTDGSRGLREWRRAISSLPLVQQLARPFPATLLALTVLTLLYATGLLEWETRQLVGHEVITAALLLIGVLLATGWKRTGEGRALSIALLGLGIAGLGMWMLIGGRVGADWFSALGWPDPRSDQHAAGIAILVLLSAGLVAGAVLRSTSKQRTGPGNDGDASAVTGRAPGPAQVRQNGRR
jgi:putative copper resistance protein D